MNFDDIRTYELLIEACSAYAIGPSMSIESEHFFRALLSQYSGPQDKDSISTWLREKIEEKFLALGERPRWIQSPEWPIASGEPAIFVGQVDVLLEGNQVASKIFHDDTSFYVFVAGKNPPIIVMQQF